MLSDSAEIKSKTNLQNLLIVDVALHIRAFVQPVEIEALTANGSQLLALMAEKLVTKAQHIMGYHSNI